MMINNRKQGGLALISVLLIFAIVAVLATAMIDRQSLDIQRSANLQALQQARAYTSGIEYAVRSGLQLDFEADKTVDHLLEEWAKPHTYPLEPGVAEIQIFDAQSRFNLNSLHKTASNRAVQIQRFKNLLAELGIDESIADRAQRFIDEESLVDNDYLSAEPPYRASYNLFKHPSELMLVEGVDREAYRKLAPYIATLPVAATINVNTASDKVLAALSTRWSLADADKVISGRGEKGFTKVDDFWGLPEVAEFTGSSENSNPGQSNDEELNNKEVWDKADFSVNSQYFEVFSKVTLADRIATVEMLIYRNAETGKMRTYYRDYSRTDAKIPPVISENNNKDANSEFDQY